MSYHGQGAPFPKRKAGKTYGNHHLYSRAANRPQLPCAAPKHWLLLSIDSGTFTLALRLWGNGRLPVSCLPLCDQGIVSKGVAGAQASCAQLCT